MDSGDTGERHGGNLSAAAARLGQPPGRLLDASASLVPFGPPWVLRRALLGACLGSAVRVYPDRGWERLRGQLAALHGLEPAQVLPGNGAAELFTWAGRDAAAAGLSLVPQPGFADYSRALACWGGRWQGLPLTLTWPEAFPQPFPALPDSPSQASQPEVLWICNPHNPTGQLWSRHSLEPLLERHRLVVCDEAFLPLVPGGEAQSLLPLLQRHPNLVVVRSLTKLLACAGLRIGYALGSPERLRRWAAWRDPWPVNGLALAAVEQLLADPSALAGWTRRVHGWLAQEQPWLRRQLGRWSQFTPMPSAANFLLLRGSDPLVELRQALERRHGILLRDCRSFEGLGACWLRLGLQDRRGHRRLLAALAQELPPTD